MIYPFWLLLIFKPEFVLWELGTVAVILLLTVANLLRAIDIWVAALGISIAVLITALRWARHFLVRMVIDLDAKGGDGLVTIERLLPAPTLPESVQLSLQDAAEGSASVNTSGLLNTIITYLSPLKWLRVFTIGDVTFRTKAGNFSMTMYSIQDPEGVRDEVQRLWRQIADFKAKERAKADRKEQIDRMTEAVAAGLKKAHEELQIAVVIPAAAPAPGTPPTDGAAAAISEAATAQSATADNATAPADNAPMESGDAPVEAGDAPAASTPT